MEKSNQITLFSFRAPYMRTFHLAWMAFFCCFFGWFGLAPLMPVIRDTLDLTRSQTGNLIIASVAATAFARLLIGWLCDYAGPRRTYAGLLIFTSLPVMLTGLSHDYETLLLFRLATGIIGASFVITQFHTSAMFGPRVVGTANATTAGWGNLGGGVTQMAMPLLYTGLVSLGLSADSAWRWAMVPPGMALLAMGIVYYRYTSDPPRRLPAAPAKNKRFAFAGMSDVLKDPRVWALFLAYAACFGVELTINNIAALYFMDHFGLTIVIAGLVAGLFGMMNFFSRSLGGWFADCLGIKYGLQGRVRFLFVILLSAGISLALFSRISVLPLALAGLLVFGLFVQMSAGATFAVVPFINKEKTGSIAGLVGAGGNVGAVVAGFLFREEQFSVPTALLILGAAVCLAAFLILPVRFATAMPTPHPRQGLPINVDLTYSHVETHRKS